MTRGKIESLLLNAVEDRVSARRAVAGSIIARVGNPAQKKSVKKLLTDIDANVRLRTAQGYLAGLDKSAIPTLIELLDKRPIYVAWQAEDLLAWAAGDTAPKELVWSGGQRAEKTKDAWLCWWKKAEATLDLRKVANESRKPGLFLLTAAQQNRTSNYLIGCNGAVRWEFADRDKNLVIAQFLPNDQYVCYQAEKLTIEGAKKAHPSGKWQYRVAQYELSGKLRDSTDWRNTHTNDFDPRTICRLANGYINNSPDTEVANNLAKFANSLQLRPVRAVSREGRVTVVLQGTKNGSGDTVYRIFDVELSSGAVILEYDRSIMPGAGVVATEGGYRIADGAVWFLDDEDDGLIRKVKFDENGTLRLRNGHLLSPSAPTGEIVELDDLRRVINRIPVSVQFDFILPVRNHLEFGFCAN